METPQQPHSQIAQEIWNQLLQHKEPGDEIHYNQKTNTFSYIDEEHPIITEEQATSIISAQTIGFLETQGFVTLYTCRDNFEISFETMTLKESQEDGTEIIPNKFYILFD